MITITLDHIVMAAPDLDGACERFHAATSVVPSAGGPHLGAGSRNALVAFEQGQYLEIIAPDPTQPRTDNLGAWLGALETDTLIAWAARTSDLGSLGADLGSRGIGCGPPRRMSRRLPDDGPLLEWELMAVADQGEGGTVPFFIDWLECDHPSETSSPAGALLDFRVTAPEGSVAASMASFVGSVSLEIGEPAIQLAFDSPNGKIVYAASAPPGFPRL